MIPKFLFRLIGDIFFQEWLLTTFFVIIILLAIAFSLKRPVVAVVFYFAISIINPQATIPLFYYIPLVKIAAGSIMISLLLNLHKARITFSKPLLALLIFLAFSAVSYTNAIIPVLADKRFGEFNKIVLICFMTVWIIVKRKDFDFLNYAAIFSIYFIIMKNLVETQTKGAWYAVRGTSGWICDSNDWGLALSMALPLFYVAIIRAKSISIKLFHGCALTSAILVLTITSSRGAFLGAAAAALVLLVTERSKLKAILAGAVVLAVVGAYMPESYTGQIRSVFKSSEYFKEAWEGELDEDKYTGAERAWNWQLAYRMAKDYPWTGVGWGNYAPAIKLYDESSGKAGVAHSTWCQVGAEAGITGLLAYALMIFVSLVSLFRTWRRGLRRNDVWLVLHSRGILAGLAAFCIAGSFVSREYSDLLFLYFAMAIILHDLSNKTDLGSEQTAGEG